MCSRTTFIKLRCETDEPNESLKLPEDLYNLLLAGTSSESDWDEPSGSEEFSQSGGGDPIEQGDEDESDCGDASNSEESDPGTDESDGDDASNSDEPGLETGSDIEKANDSLKRVKVRTKKKFTFESLDVNLRQQISREVAAYYRSLSRM